MLICANSRKNGDNLVELKHFVRVANTDLKGDKRLLVALTKIKGVGMVFANLVCNLSGIDPQKKAGELSDSEVAMMDKVLSDPVKNGAPSWIINRRKDYETGEDKHLILSDLDFSKQDDIKQLKKCKTYKGLRHQWGLPVRGQKTKANFRPNKGKVKVPKKKTVLKH